ncbi:MAG: hypothetical protein KF749_00610 [Bacteroidetes bacterium]|nr:hypothetical protein [Bacteroidota bacterium]MCW5895130.1 hypothetical protein [Bacteroidota bacterium]
MMTECLEKLSTGFRSLLAVTESLCDCVEDGDVLMLSDLIEEREQLLRHQNLLTDEWKRFYSGQLDAEAALAALHSLFGAMKRADDRLVRCLAEKKAELSEKLHHAQNEKLLLVYSR